MVKYSKWNSIPNNLKAISALVIAYSLLTLLIWIIVLIAVYAFGPTPITYALSQLDVYSVLGYILYLLIIIVLPFIICLFIAKNITRKEKWARIMLILLASIVLLKEVPMLIELLTTQVSFTFPTLITAIPSLLKLSGSAGIIISLFRKRIKEVFK